MFKFCINSSAASLYEFVSTARFKTFSTRLDDILPVIPALFEEADGLWINLQGKDRQEQIEKYKLNCEKENKEYKEPTSVKSELKLHVSYEGWKKDDERHSLVNKMYIVGFMSSKEMKKRRDAKIFQTYDVSKIKLRVLNRRWSNLDK